MDEKRLASFLYRAIVTADIAPRELMSLKSDMDSGEEDLTEACRETRDAVERVAGILSVFMRHETARKETWEGPERK